MHKFKSALKILSAVLLVTYPLFIYIGLKYLPLFFLAPMIMLICAIRIVTLQSNIKEWLWVMRTVLVLTVILCGFALIMRSASWMLYYPVIVNIIMLCVFSYSLIKPPTMIERFARLQDPNLPDAAIRYTRKITQIWCGFFIMNGTISIVTTQLSIEYWTLYNGLMSYIFMGILLAGEWLYRKLVLKVI